MGGLLGGGIMVLISSIYINITGENGCCGNRFGMFLSIAFAAVGVAGALYSFTVAMVGLHKPKNVVPFNAGLFLTLMVTSGLQGLLCVYLVSAPTANTFPSLGQFLSELPSESSSNFAELFFHSDNMCTGKCSRCIAVTLYPLALISIICNIVLFFPGGDVKYAQDGHITEEVKYMGGLIGGGIMVLLPALYIHLTGTKGCCGNRCGMFLSIAFAAVGVAGALYSFIVAVLGPKNIVQFNIGLFATLLATSGLQLILCAIQMINGLFGCLCGTCGDKGAKCCILIK
ncbi:hypothetical protein F7725_006576 [Dissostichus mawsoni]|uniref:Uncharacterized protein n=1 Tax=Dissostichus mawsoni TaxID=36200 RepID=A0A7J5XU97_DISMA|nr:hypothetical protein F7725_006576 [Dissostichus mawsoni]